MKENIWSDEVYVRLGKEAMRFIDRLGDPCPSTDPAERICSEAYSALIQYLPPLKAPEASSDENAPRQQIHIPAELGDPSDIVGQLRIRAFIRRRIASRKSVQNGEPDRLADLLDRAADEIQILRNST